MNLKNSSHSRYRLVQEMMQTPEIIRRIDPKAAQAFVPALKTSGRLFLTGEGSSRIFPAKRAVYEALDEADALAMATDGATQALDYDLGAYAVNGIEEVMDAEELVVVVEPFESEEEKFHEVLNDGEGLEVVAISTRKTSFPTVVIPDAGELQSYVEIAAGWNLLVEIGIALGIDLDKPERARKVGNIYQGN